MRKLFLTGTSLAVLALMPVAPASAITPVTLTGSYTVSETYNSSNGGPTVTDDLASPFSLSEGATPNAFTLSPNPSSGSQCSGGGCNTSTTTETDSITFNLTGLSVSGLTGSPATASNISEGGTFTAKYTGSELGCAAGDGVSPSSGNTDCLVWNGAANTYNGSATYSETLSNGQTLTVTFNNATDWDITPTVSFTVTGDVTAVPEASTWAMMLLGFAGLGYAGFRSRKAAISIA
jgi:PEP-CTERM motif